MREIGNTIVHGKDKKVFECELCHQRTTFPDLHECSNFCVLCKIQSPMIELRSVQLDGGKRELVCEHCIDKAK